MAFGSLSPFRRSAPDRGDGDPFAAMRREMERLFEDFGGGFPLAAGKTGGTAMAPRVNVKETDGGLEVTAELPGVEAKDIDVEVSDGVLTIAARHSEAREEKPDDKTTWHVVERRSGSFLRRLPLPFDPTPDQVSADFRNGVLTVALPRPPEAASRTRRIEVKGG